MISQIWPNQSQDSAPQGMQINVEQETWNERVLVIRPAHHEDQEKRTRMTRLSLSCKYPFPLCHLCALLCLTCMRNSNVPVTALCITVTVNDAISITKSNVSNKDRAGRCSVDVRSWYAPGDLPYNDAEHDYYRRNCVYIRTPPLFPSLFLSSMIQSSSLTYLSTLFA